jgi:hypothetical protein
MRMRPLAFQRNMNICFLYMQQHRISAAMVYEQVSSGQNGA